MEADVEVQQLYQKMTAIAAINREIIQRIKRELSVLCFTARLQDRTHLVVDHTAAQREFFGWWRWDGQLVAVRDTFKDKVDYSRCRTFEQLELLNDKLVLFADQYRAFEDSAFAATELRQYLTNYELIQTALGQVDAQFQANAAQYHDPDRVELVNAATSRTNVALAELAHLGVHLADVQGRPLFDVQIKADLDILGIAATRDGNVAVLCWNETICQAWVFTYTSQGKLVKKVSLFGASDLLLASGLAAEWGTDRLFFTLGQIMVHRPGSGQVVCLLRPAQASAATASATGPPPLSTEPSGALVKPQFLAAGANGLVYVTQRHRMVITVFDASTGALVRTIARPTPLQPSDQEETATTATTTKKKKKTTKTKTTKRAAVRGLSGIAVHPTTGNIYAADPDNARVLIFTPEGEFEGSFHLGEGHSDPAGITIDAQGNVFVAEQQNNRVLVFHSHGGAPLVVGGGAEASLELIRSPRAVAVVGDRVFVANEGKTIHVFSFLH